MAEIKKAEEKVYEAVLRGELLGTIAEDFHVSFQTISKIARRDRWQGI